MAVATCVIVIPWAFGGYARYDIQGASSGSLPVSYLRNGSSDLMTCIAPLASYNRGGTEPQVNTIPPLPLDGFLVRPDMTPAVFARCRTVAHI
jgi:hypothetical protein